jgi:hypothetical protein
MCWSSFPEREQIWNLESETLNYDLLCKEAQEIFSENVQA